MLARICFFSALLYIASGAVEYSCPDNSQVFYPHPASCEKFIECNNGISKEIDCFAGTHFNPAAGFCDIPQNVECKIEEVTDPPDLESAESEENNGGEFSCQDNSQGFYPHPTSCEKFIECNNGISKEIDCFAGTHFNAAMGFCDLPENVECVVDSEEQVVTDPPTEESEEQVDPDPPTEESEEQLDPDPPTEESEEQEVTDQPIEESEESEENNGGATTGPSGKCPAQNGEYVTFLTDLGDCTKYYMCNWGLAIKMNCPSGLHFNPTLDVCDWPYNAGCTV